MSTISIVLAVIYILICLALIGFILLQSSKNQYMNSVISGGAETFFGKNKGRSIDSKLRKLTTVCAVLFVIVTLALALIK